MKTCTVCGVEKTRADFNKNGAGLSCRCKPCDSAKTTAWKRANPKKNAENSRKWREANPANPEKVAENKRRSRYGLEPHQYDAMLVDQSGACAICFAGFDKTPYVDHCHDSGKVRGLLCQGCNTGIGMLKDSQINLHSAIRYLKLHQSAEEHTAWAKP